MVEITYVEDENMLWLRCGSQRLKFEFDGNDVYLGGRGIDKY